MIPDEWHYMPAIFDDGEIGLVEVYLARGSNGVQSWTTSPASARGETVDALLGDLTAMRAAAETFKPLPLANFVVGFVPERWRSPPRPRSKSQ